MRISDWSSDVCSSDLTITIDAQQIQNEGFTDLGEVIRSIPQNYSGGQNPGVTAGAYAGGYKNMNTSGGSSANLRGIGQDATLTLLNGRRMSYGSNDQAVDIDRKSTRLNSSH